MCGVSFSPAVTPAKTAITDAAPAATSPVAKTAADAPASDVFETRTPPRAPVALDPWADAPAWDNAGIGGGGTAAVDPTRR